VTRFFKVKSYVYLSVFKWGMIGRKWSWGWVRVQSQSVGDPALIMRVSGGPGSDHEGQWGTRLWSWGSVGDPALFMRVSGGPGSVHEPDCRREEAVGVAWGLAPVDLSFLPEGRDSNSFFPGSEGSAAICLPRFRVLEANKSWREGSLEGGVATWRRAWGERTQPWGGTGSDGPRGWDMSS